MLGSRYLALFTLYSHMHSALYKTEYSDNFDTC
jgi:hypothetical protein